MIWYITILIFQFELIIIGSNVSSSWYWCPQLQKITKFSILYNNNVDYYVTQTKRMTVKLSKIGNRQANNYTYIFAVIRVEQMRILLSCRFNKLLFSESLLLLEKCVLQISNFSHLKIK